MAPMEQAERMQSIMMDTMQQVVNGVFLGAEPEIKYTLSKSEEGMDLADLNIEAELLALHLEMQL